MRQAAEAKQAGQVGRWLKTVLELKVVTVVDFQKSHNFCLLG